MAPHRINIYADRQGVNESLQKRERSKTTELRPSNEDLGKNTANLLIVWQAVRAPVPFSPPSIPFTCFSNANRPSSVGFKVGTTLRGYGSSMEHNIYTVHSATIMYLTFGTKVAAGNPITALQTFNNRRFNQLQ